MSIKITQLPEVKTKGQTLEDCIDILSHTPAQLEEKIDRLNERLKTLAVQVRQLDFHAEAEMEIDMSQIVGQGPAYAAIFTDVGECEDEEMEIRRLNELVENVTQTLQTARNEYLGLQELMKKKGGIGSVPVSGASSKKKKAPPVPEDKETKALCKKLDQLLWKAEVDIENIEDILMRYLDNVKATSQGWNAKMAEIKQNLDKQVFETGTQISEALSSSYQALRRWTVKK